MPDDQALVSIAVPVLLVVSADSHDFFAEVAGRLSKGLGADVVTSPGRHGAYHDRPKELAETIRPFPARSQSVLNGSPTSRCVGVSHAPSHDPSIFGEVCPIGGMDARALAARLDAERLGRVAPVRREPRVPVRVAPGVVGSR
jgi:hypothetical protein